MTIIVQFKLEENVKRKETILSHSGCNGWVLTIYPNSEIVFEERCSDKIFRSGYFVPVNIKATIILTYNGEFVTFRLKEFFKDDYLAR